VRLTGAWYAALVGLFLVDIAVAAADVWVETASRKGLGGLPRGEYLAHVVLSVLAGAVICSVFSSSAAWASEDTAIAWSANAPWPIRALLGLMALGSLAVATYEALDLVDRSLPRPRPLHVSVRLATTVRALWNTTQDHVLHPSWDHRFTKITMLAEKVETGTEMLYERRIACLTIRGGGRYKLHRPLKQSTFEFWSSSPLSLIVHGVGLWLYRSMPDGRVELSTSYTYEVRWGLVGRLIDRAIFRPLMQRETERSFARLARVHFPVRASRVLGAAGRKPARLLEAA
jgi:hypothetical protein